MREFAAVLTLFALCAHASPDLASAQERPWTVEDVLALRSPWQVAVSPDGKWVAYALSHRNLGAGENPLVIWLAGKPECPPPDIYLATTGPFAPKRLTELIRKS